MKAMQIFFSHILLGKGKSQLKHQYWKVVNHTYILPSPFLF